MSTVKAPYHFVPLSKWTCLPDWASQISHDRPFKDGISGCIDLSIHTHSPLLIGAEKKGYAVEFVKDPNGQPLIPGTSLSGMLRNVLEIATFSDMNFLDDDRFGVRDISRSNTNYAKYYKKHDLITGWLKFDRERSQWMFSKCDYVEVRYTVMEELNEDLNEKNDPIDKYEAHPLSQEIRFTAGKEERDRGRGQKKEMVNIATQLHAGDKKGYLVFVGKMKGKTGDYLFSPPMGDEILVSNSVYRDFKVSHYDHGGSYGDKKKTLFEFLQNCPDTKMNGLGIPVFALCEKNTKKPEIKALGLTKMMKIAAPYSIHYLYRQHKNLNAVNTDETHENSPNQRIDMAQAIFGLDHPQAGTGLKGRVSVADAFVVAETVKHGQTVKTILASPRASYYPAYLAQEAKSSGYNDYFVKSARLAGWKRYPIRTNFNPPPSPDGKKNVVVTMKPLAKGARFETRLRFHNLKKVELGALLWAINFGGEDNSFHSLGMGKPFGLGKVSIHYDAEQSFETFAGEALNAIELRKGFEQYIDQQYGLAFDEKQQWEKSAQIQNLLAMARPSSNEKQLKYMSLPEYSKSKNNRWVLLPYKNYSPPDDVKKLKDISVQHDWENSVNRIANDIRNWLNSNLTPSTEALDYLKIQLNKNWPDLLTNPDAQKQDSTDFIYTKSQRVVARKILAIKSGSKG